MNEAAWQRARDQWTTPEFEHAQRKKIEALLAELMSRNLASIVCDYGVEVRPETILPCRHGPEPQATGQVAEWTNNTLVPALRRI